MAVVLGVLVAAAFGSGDFLGGRATASAAPPRVLAVSQACSFLTAAAVVALVGSRVAASDLGLGAAAGLANVGGLALLYRALSTNAAGVVAPITAVVGALVPVGWGLLRGERPSTVALAGAFVAIAAAALVAHEPASVSPRRVAAGAFEAAAAGVALGSSLILFSETSRLSGLWPVLAARGSALAVVLLVYLAIRRVRSRPARTTSWPGLAAGAGVLDATANVLIVLAVRRGLLVVVAPVASLAPAFTVSLAWLVLGERLHIAQRLGCAAAAVGVALVAGG